MTASGLPARVAALLGVAAAAYAGHREAAPAVAELRARLDEPLRVALGGQGESGKVDAAERTRRPRPGGRRCGRLHSSCHVVRARPGVQRDGVSRWSAHAGGTAAKSAPIEVDLGGLDDASVDRVVVEWPSPMLHTMTLIDTPGLGTLDGALDARGRSFLLPSDQPSAADAVIYLTRHMHAHDVRFLEAFHDDDAGGPSPVNTIGVVSRADEIGAARISAMASAQRVAERYGTDVQIAGCASRLCPSRDFSGSAPRSSPSATSCFSDASPRRRRKRRERSCCRATDWRRCRARLTSAPTIGRT